MDDSPLVFILHKHVWAAKTDDFYPDLKWACFMVNRGQRTKESGGEAYLGSMGQKFFSFEVDYGAEI